MGNKVIQIAVENMQKIVTDPELSDNWTRAWTLDEARITQNFVSGHKYKGWNMIFLNLFKEVRGYDCPYFTTIKGALSKKGRINEEEMKKGFPIVFCKHGWQDLDTKKYVNAEDLKPDGNYRKTFTYKYYRVWNCEQTNLDWRDRFNKLSTAKDHNPIEAAEAVLKHFPNLPEIKHGAPSYSPSMDVIRVMSLGENESPEHYYKTLFHELAHATGHPSRLNRKFGDKFGDVEYSKEELIAESAAMIVMNTLGLTTESIKQQYAAYYRGWFKQSDLTPEQFYHGINKSVKVAEYILQGYFESLEK